MDGSPARSGQRDLFSWEPLSAPVVSEAWTAGQERLCSSGAPRGPSERCPRWGRPAPRCRLAESRVENNASPEASPREGAWGRERGPGLLPAPAPRALSVCASMGPPRELLGAGRVQAHLACSCRASGLLKRAPGAASLIPRRSLMTHISQAATLGSWRSRCCAGKPPGTSSSDWHPCLCPVLVGPRPDLLTAASVPHLGQGAPSSGASAPGRWRTAPSSLCRISTCVCACRLSRVQLGGPGPGLLCPIELSKQERLEWAAISSRGMVFMAESNTI